MSSNIVELKLSELASSPTNPRQHFDESKLAELAASIKKDGVMSPLLVRPRGKGYEIVAGERRWRAAKLAGVKAALCVVRELDDCAALELQMIENLQRDDLTALEEARGYAAMLELRGADGQAVYTVEKLATAVNKSTRHIRARRQLARLGGAALTALESGEIGATQALVLCRVQDAALLEEATREVLHPQYQRGPLSKRETEELIAGKYARSLKGAAFSLKDETLIPDATGCVGCAKCSTSEDDFFGKTAGMCFDVACFKRKLAAQWQRERDAAAANNEAVMSVEDAEKIFDNADLSWPNSDKFLLLDEKQSDYECAEGVKPQRWDKVLKGLAVPVTLALDGTGAPRRLVNRNDAIAALNAAGRVVLREQKVKANVTADSDAAKAERKEQILREKIKKTAGFEAGRLLLGRLKAFSASDGLPDDFWSVIAGGVLRYHAANDGCRWLLKMLGAEIGRDGDFEGQLLKLHRDATPCEWRALALMGLLARSAAYNAIESSSFKELLPLFGLDAGAIKKEVAATLKRGKRKDDAPPLPAGADAKILKAWILKFLPPEFAEISPGEAWGKLEQAQRDAFAEWVETTKKAAPKARRKKGADGDEPPLPLPANADEELLGKLMKKFLPEEYYKMPPFAAWEKLDNGARKALLGLMRGEIKAAYADEPADGEGADEPADDADDLSDYGDAADGHPIDGEPAPVRQFQIPLGEIAAVADDDARLDALTQRDQRTPGVLANALNISRAAAAAWLKRLAVREMGVRQS